MGGESLNLPTTAAQNMNFISEASTADQKRERERWGTKERERQSGCLSVTVQ